jgi:hypothetical protein
MLSSGHACRWRVASAGPRLTLRASVPPEKGSSGLEDEGDAHRTGRPSQEHRHPDHPGGQSGLPQALQQVVEAAKLLFEADGAGLMLVGKDELLTWASASDPQAERAEAVQAEQGARDLHGRLAAAEPSGGAGRGGRIGWGG